MSRDQIATIHFSHTKNKTKNANDVLKRLTDRDLIVRVPRFHKCFLYMPNPRKLPLESSKRTHDLALVDFYIQLKNYGTVTVHGVEKELDHCRPDLILHYNGQLYYVEIQLTHEGNNRMKQRLAKYELHVREGKYKIWGELPVLWIHSPNKYDINSSHIQIKQTKLV